MDNTIDAEFKDGNVDDCDNESSSSDSSAAYKKLSLPEHILAYIERRELLRDYEEVSCDNHLKDNVMNNYVIVKRILSNLSWQDKLLCKHVCRTWYSAVLALQKEQLCPADFVIDLHLSQIKNGVKLKQSSELHTEPLVVFSFVNDTGFGSTSRCLALVPSPCDPPCEKEHCLMDYLQNKVAAPKECIFTVRACYLSYRPLEQSKTSDHAIKQRMLRRTFPIICGVYIPMIPDVKFHIINIKTNTDMQNDFYDVVSNLAQGCIFKGVLVYVTEKFIVQSFIEECAYLNYFKEVVTGFGDGEILRGPEAENWRVPPREQRGMLGGWHLPAGGVSSPSGAFAQLESVSETRTSALVSRCRGGAFTRRRPTRLKLSDSAVFTRGWRAPRRCWSGAGSANQTFHMHWAAASLKTL
ncbi:unnamed protein product [Chilo suppressalis]|uniref:F-box domain-containing protein n=1 Tax=Chilo suppressalis TaxID=168631 RepID=A0ABN8L5V3_CHISP|nr:unnamed protein product [Chilo suppressalis]